jgi:hypothetical protein
MESGENVSVGGVVSVTAGVDGGITAAGVSAELPPPPQENKFRDTRKTDARLIQKEDFMIQLK